MTRRAGTNRHGEPTKANVNLGWPPLDGRSGSSRGKNSRMASLIQRRPAIYVRPPLADGLGSRLATVGSGAGMADHGENQSVAALDRLLALGCVRAGRIGRARRGVFGSWRSRSPACATARSVAAFRPGLLRRGLGHR